MVKELKRGMKRKRKRQKKGERELLFQRGGRRRDSKATQLSNRPLKERERRIASSLFQTKERKNAIARVSVFRILLDVQPASLSM